MEEGRFRYIEGDESRRPACGDLPAQLGTDGSRRTRDQYDAILQLAFNLQVIHLDGPASEQVLDGDLAELPFETLARKDLRHRGHRPESDSSSPAQLDDTAYLRPPSRRESDQYLLD